MEARRTEYRNTCVKEGLVEGHGRRGKSLGRWKNRAKEYMCERTVSRESQ